MSDYMRGARTGLFFGLSIALCISLQAYGFESLLSRIMFGTLVLMVIPMVYYQCVLQGMRARAAFVHEQSNVACSALRKHRLERVVHLRAVSDDSEET